MQIQLAEQIAIWNTDATPQAADVDRAALRVSERARIEVRKCIGKYIRVAAQLEGRTELN
jgi:hypothetical protein